MTTSPSDKELADWMVEDAAPIAPESRRLALVNESTRIEPFDVIRAADVVSRTIEWLWHGYIPLGMLTILEGDPGLGKSTLALSIAAAVSAGYALTGSVARPAADVVLFTYEDDLGAVVRPRLEAAGANLDRIQIVRGIVGNDRLPVFPTDLPRLADLVRDCAARLVVIDPFTAALSTAVNSYKDQDVRSALSPLAKLAAETSASVLIVRHFPKSSSGRAIAAGGGSIGIAAAARSILALHSDADNTDRRVLAVVKSNIARIAPSLSLRIAINSTGHPLIDWLGESPLTADGLAAHRAFTAPPEESALGVDEWLRRLLHGERMLQKDVMKTAHGEGFSPSATYRAARRIGAVQKREGFGKDLKSWWSLATSGSATHAISANER
jgi:archaellum biogenesis ATPase FlaH